MRQSSAKAAILEATSQADRSAVDFARSLEVKALSEAARCKLRVLIWGPTPNASGDQAEYATKRRQIKEALEAEGHRPTSARIWYRQELQFRRICWNCFTRKRWMRSQTLQPTLAPPAKLMRWATYFGKNCSYGSRSPQGRNL